MVSKFLMIGGNNESILIVANNKEQMNEFCAKEEIIRMAAQGKVKLTSTFKEEVQKDLNVLNRYLDENL